MLEYFLRITIAALLAGAIGLERELRLKEAGLKTHFLVGIGSALIMIVSKYGFYDILGTKGIALDPSRIAAQVISGISFLGAGTIIFEKHYIKGLTTAAGIWATAGIGIAVGAGMYDVGIFSTVLVLIGLEVLNRLLKNRLYKYYEINIWAKNGKMPDIQSIAEDNNLILSEFKFKRIPENENMTFIKVKLKGSEKGNYSSLLNSLSESEDVVKVETDM